jgi:hypothetical protein
MNEQRAFTIVITGCSNCPAANPGAFSYSKTCNMASTIADSQKLFHENVQGITPTCPMFEKSKIIGELK